MRRLAYLGGILGIVSLVLLLAFGTVLAQDGVPGIPGEGEIEPGGLPGEGEGEPGAGAGEVDAFGTAARIDFEFTDQSAREGTYVIKEIGGRTLGSWYALDGWRDSGWMNGLDISHEAVHVEVLYYPYAGAEPTVMEILNPAGGTEYGWLARDVEHALEVKFQDTVNTYAYGAPAYQPVVVAPQTGGPATYAGATVPTYQPVTATGEQVYVVQPGNNLFRIGLAYGCPYQQLAAHNGIPNPDLIYPGQPIHIPAGCG